MSVSLCVDEVVVFCRLFVVVLDAELFLHLTVVEDAEDVLAGAVDGAAQQEVGEAEVVVLTGQDVVTIGSHRAISLSCNLVQLVDGNSDETLVEVLHLLETANAVVISVNHFEENLWQELDPDRES